MLLSSESATEQYVFPLWIRLKKHVLDLLSPFVKEECQILSVKIIHLKPGPEKVELYDNPWAMITNRIVIPLQSGNSSLRWYTQDASGAETIISFDISSQSRFQLNTKQKHSLLVSRYTSLLVADVMDQCSSSIPANSTFIKNPSLCTFRDVLECSQPGEGAGAEKKPQKAKTISTERHNARAGKVFAGNSESTGVIPGKRRAAAKGKARMTTKARGKAKAKAKAKVTSSGKGAVVNGESEKEKKSTTPGEKVEL